MTYAELVAAIQSYLETTEASFVAMIPTIVRQAEGRILRSVQLPEFRKNATLTLTSGNAFVNRPSDFLSVFSMAVVDGDGLYVHLIDKDMNFIREAYPNPATTGVPKYYAQYVGSGPDSAAGRFIFGPTPDDNYSVEIQYCYDPPSIVDAGTSWVGDNAEPALLYGCLHEAYVYLKGDADLVALYKGRYEEALAQLAGLDIRSKRDAYRDGDIRVE